MRRSIYALGFRRGSRMHYLKTRETNFRRACKSLRDLLRGNKRYKIGYVSRVVFDGKGNEINMKPLYTAQSKNLSLRAI